MKAAVSFAPGLQVMAKGRSYHIHRICDLESALVIDAESGATTSLPLTELQPFAAEGGPESAVLRPATTIAADLSQISDHDWAIARTRYEAIAPLLGNSRNTPEKVSVRATETERHCATLYRWLDLYMKDGTLAALLPAKRGASPGQKRLSQEVEQVISTFLKKRFLSKQRVKAAKVAREIIAYCKTHELAPPDATTIRRRINALPESTKILAREGAKATRQRFAPVQGSFPGADAPLRVVQIDHTPVDLELVDDIHRRPIGKPWITLAIDVYSRMVAGFSVSFDPPSSLSVGLCLTHAIVPKERWLAKYELASTWPVWGFMDAIHCDNAKEFHGAMLQKACENYGIDLLFRPVQRPHYGGHIERLLGTFASEIHSLPGTTFSNPEERGSYDSEGNAALTLLEFEKWLAIQIVDVYHRRPHSELGLPPVLKYEKGILGDETHPGRGLPARCADETKLRLDFLPYFERTVQRSGFSIDEIHYFSDVLRRWIDARDPADRARKRSFIVRRDPRDISVVYFFDPEVQQYFRIPYRDRSRPAMSIWELRQIRNKLRGEGHFSADEHLIFAAYDRLRAIEEQAVRTTKALRRKQQRQRSHANFERPLLSGARASTHLDALALESAEDIRPFDEIEVLS